MKLQIKIDGESLDLLPGTSITLERYNPMFDFETVRGSKVLDFEVPFSPINDKIFGHYRNTQAIFKDKTFFCEKIANGILIEKGFVELRSVSDKGYMIAFSQNLGEIFGDYQSTPLNKINFGSETLLTLYANANHLTDKYCLPTIVNHGFYQKQAVSGFNGKVNEYLGSAYNVNAPRVPMFFLRWIFEQIAQKCSFKFEGEFFESEEFKTAFLYNTFSLDEQTQIVYQNHLPEISIPELLKELKKLFNLSLFFDVQSRILHIKFSKTLFNQKIKLDWSDKVKPSSGRSPERANKLEFDWQLDTGDALMKSPSSDFLKNQTDGTNLRTGTFFNIKTRFSTLTIDPTTNLPIAEQTGISPKFNQGSNTFSPRILFWKGLISNIPTASNTTNISRLALHGVDNIVDKYYSEYQSWRGRTSSRKILAMLTAKDLADIDFHARKGKNVGIYIHGRNYYIASLRVNLPLTNYTELEIWEV